MGPYPTGETPGEERLSAIDDLTEELVVRGMRGAFGTPVRVFDEIGSTNSEAMRWANEGAPEGALVVTNHQTAGRGRRGRSWWSEPGTALQFSLVIRPRRQLDVMGLLTTAVGLACVEGVEIAAGVRADLKWPNDVTVSGRKLAGILVESRVTGGMLDFAIIGIGINVYPSPGAPADVATRATSVYEAASEKEPNRVEVLGWVLDAFERIYPLLGTGEGAAAIVERATNRSDVLGNRVTVKIADGDVLEGVARRLLPSGALEVEIAGEFRAVHAGEIVQLRPA
jgi:BirA family transcriptional regulator, biotin operon repressor / biotin---[acetyl-CoA-carboxylase] ligase